MDGNIEITKADSYIFTDSKSNDMIVYTSDPSQNMMFGTQTNSTSAIKINSTNITFNRTVNYTSNLGIQATPKVSFHAGKEIYTDSNNAIWPTDHGRGIYMRYSTMSNENAGYIQSVERIESNINFQDMYLQAKNIYFSTGTASVENVPRMTIASNGWIGINTFTPGDMFSVNGNIYAQSNLILQNNHCIVYGSNIGVGKAGRVGYGLFNSNSLDLVGGATETETGRYITFHINSNQGAGQSGKAVFNGGNVILNTGKISIGSSNPVGALHIAKDNTLCNNVVIEGGKSSDGANEGFSAVNFNGYFNNINHRINTNKNRWRVYVDQTSNSDCLGIDSFNGITNCNYLTLSNLNVGINTTNPRAKLHIIGNTLSDGNHTSNNPLTLEDTSGNAMRVLHINTNSIDSTIYNYQASKNVFWGELNDTGYFAFRGKNVGIGNSNPDKRLCIGNGTDDVSSAIKFNTGDCDKIYMTSSNNGSKISHSSGWNFNIHAGQSNAYSGTISFQTGSNYGYLERMRIDKSGNVGINTSAPYSTLHIVGSPSVNRLLTIDGTQLSNSAMMSVLGNSAQLTGIELIDPVNALNAWNMVRDQTTDLRFNHASGTTPLSLKSNGTVVIMSKMGVGVSNPENDFHVNTTVQVGSYTAAQTEAKILLKGNNQTLTRQWSLSTGTTNIASTAYNTQRFKITEDSTERLTIDTNGFFGFNTSNPQSVLHAAGSTPKCATFESIGSNLSSYIYFKNSNNSLCYVGADGDGFANISPGSLAIATMNNYNCLIITSNAERMRITSNGNVGINTKSPSESLHVLNGNIICESNDNVYTKISGPIINIQGGSSAAVLFKCYVEAPRAGVHLESRGSTDSRQIVSSNAGLPFYLNTECGGSLITGGSIYPLYDNSNSMGLSSNKWREINSSNVNAINVITNTIIALDSINSSNNMTLTASNDKGVRLNLKRYNATEQWFLRGPDWTDGASMVVGYSNGTNDYDLVRFDSGLQTNTKSISVYGQFTAHSNSSFQSTLYASNIVNNTFYSVVADVTSYFSYKTVAYGPGTFGNVIQYTPNSNLSYNVSSNAFTNFRPPVSGLWQVDATLTWPQYCGSFYGISLVKNYYSVLGSMIPGGTILDFYKIGDTGLSNTRPTSILNKDYRFDMRGSVYLAASDSLTTVIGYSSNNQIGNNVGSFVDCRMKITLLQRTG